VRIVRALIGVSLVAMLPLTSGASAGPRSRPDVPVRLPRPVLDSPSTPIDWSQERFDATHAGYNPFETKIRKRTVGDLRFLFGLQGNFIAPPLEVAGLVDVPFEGRIDAIQPSGAPVWTRSFKGGLARFGHYQGRPPEHPERVRHAPRARHRARGSGAWPGTGRPGRGPLAGAHVVAVLALPPPAPPTPSAACPGEGRALRPGARPGERRTRPCLGSARWRGSSPSPRRACHTRRRRPPMPQPRFLLPSTFSRSVQEANRRIADVRNSEGEIMMFLKGPSADGTIRS